MNLFHFYNVDVEQRASHLIEKKNELLKLKPDTRRINPLILVVDLDSTILFADEERLTSNETLTLPCFYRTEIHAFLARLKHYFDDKILLILWSTGKDAYVYQMTLLLGLHEFDYVFAETETNESLKKFGCPKSVKYIVDHSYIRKWLSRQIMNSHQELNPIFAIIDDKARQNSCSATPYNYTFCPTPLNLKTIQKTEHGFNAKIESLLEYANYLIVDLIFDKQPNVDISPAFETFYYNEEYRYGEFIFLPESFSHDVTNFGGNGN